MLKRLYEISKFYLQNTGCNCCDGSHLVFPVSKENNDDDGVISPFPADCNTKKANKKTSKRNKVSQ